MAPAIKKNPIHLEESMDKTEPTKAAMAVDKVHLDEAVTVLASYSGPQTWTAEEEQKLRKKIDRRLLPILVICYGLQYYDKAMISQAALFGLRTDLKLTVGNRFSFASSIFYLGFIAGAYPAIIMAQRFPVERVAASIILAWGVCLICTPACHNWQGLFAQRFFLGFIESGVSPMFMLVVGQFYKKNEQALRIGVWYCACGYVSIVSPLINYGFGHVKGALSPWRYMYLFAGSITILWSVVVYYCLPPDPIRAKGFTEREHFIAVSRLQSNNSGVRNTHFKKEQMVELLGDLKFWIMFLMTFLSMFANAPVSTFTPLIISGFGFNTLNSLLLVVPVGFFTGTAELIIPFLAYKYPNIRTYLVAVAHLITVFAAILLWALPRHAIGGLMLGVVILPCFAAGYVIMLGLQIANTAGYTKRSLASSGIFVAYCLGNFVAPLTFRSQDAPNYAPGLATVVATSLAVAALSIVYRFVCIRENRKRDQTGTLEAFDHAYEDDLTDKKIVLKLVGEGAHVLAVDLNGAEAEQTVRLCPQPGSSYSSPGSCHAYTADITLESSWRQILSTARRLFDDRLDVVVNCAGVIQDAAPSHEVPEEQFDLMFKVNVKPLYLSTKVIVPWWKQTKRPGLFINLSSTSEPRPRPYFVWYAASKGAVTATTKGLAAEYASDNIRYNCIRPSIGETAMLSKVLGDPDSSSDSNRREKILGSIPLGRVCKPEDVANMTCFLASDEATYITGAAFDVDGGRGVS
ncbi:hypothetical protein LTR10_019980 [Elasticomyces elasticus]|uniref:Major facilitator superfamily (MFS) profile domain-containing protein n=1 Tax=Exophiala sideris TaxID=1016849 RepID=A0ABR0IY94_9EURO|nr:hypothetical protein LTR10_019980 [Elasticomyces elasticus]KAK5022445.1 hypothetical protein LTS07_010105 [Exophiala sideris]KAK5051299.1 hypothetical protein LTR69_010325 [Exophiala sideris]